jgi:hypothetical protein
MIGPGTIDARGETIESCPGEGVAKLRCGVAKLDESGSASDRMR